jgi:hypothetical protein
MKKCREYMCAVRYTIHENASPVMAFNLIAYLTACNCGAKYLTIYTYYGPTAHFHFSFPSRSKGKVAVTGIIAPDQIFY